MDARVALDITVGVASLVVIGLAGWAMVWLARAGRSATRFFDEVGAKGVVVLDKADATLDGLNAELVRVDAIVTRVRDVSEAIGSTTDAAQGLVGSVTSRVTRAGSGLRALLAAFGGSRRR